MDQARVQELMARMGIEFDWDHKFIDTAANQQKFAELIELITGAIRDYNDDPDDDLSPEWAEEWMVG